MSVHFHTQSKKELKAHKLIRSELFLVIMLLQKKKNVFAIVKMQAMNISKMFLSVYSGFPTPCILILSSCHACPKDFARRCNVGIGIGGRLFRVTGWSELLLFGRWAWSQVFGNKKFRRKFYMIRHRP